MTGGLRVPKVNFFFPLRLLLLLYPLKRLPDDTQGLPCYLSRPPPHIFYFSQTLYLSRQISQEYYPTVLPSFRTSHWYTRNSSFTHWSRLTLEEKLRSEPSSKVTPPPCTTFRYITTTFRIRNNQNTFWGFVKDNSRVTYLGKVLNKHKNSLRQKEFICPSFHKTRRRRVKKTGREYLRQSKFFFFFFLNSGRSRRTSRSCI